MSLIPAPTHSTPNAVVTVGGRVQPKARRLQLLDAGRFVAAVSVMLFHYFVSGVSNGKISSLAPIPEMVGTLKYGYLGVEFFFMISGYVIFFSAQNRRASEFAVSRAVRLYPAFWVAVCFTALVASVWGGRLMSVRLTQVAGNLTMMPALFGYPYVDGVYWTLQLELAFYLAVFLCLLAGWQKKLGSIALAWPVVMLGLFFAGPQRLPLLSGYYYYFAAGALFATWKMRPSLYAVGSLLICLYLCINYSVNNAAVFAPGRGVTYSSAVIATIVCGYFAIFAFINSPRGSRLEVPGSQWMGGVTYPLYLVHAHFGFMFLSRFATAQNRLWIYPVTIALSLTIAHLIHRWVEQQFAREWHELFARSLGRLVESLTRQTKKLPGLFSGLSRKSRPPLAAGESKS